MIVKNDTYENIYIYISYISFSGYLLPQGQGGGLARALRVQADAGRRGVRHFQRQNVFFFLYILKKKYQKKKTFIFFLN